jgi:hypothetical protein
MKLLFVCIYADTPHFETELELMADLLAKGHEVHVLRCTSQLAACTKNPLHLPSRCMICVSKIDAGLAAIASPRLTVETMPSSPIEPRLPAGFDDVDQLKQYTIDGANLGRGVYSSLGSRLDKNTRFDTRRYTSDVRRELESAWAMFVATRRTLERERPAAVYLFNGRFSTSYAVIEACRLGGVDYYTHERGGTAERYMVRKNALPHDLAAHRRDLADVWGDGGAAKVERGRSWFVGRRNGSEESWLSFTKAQSAGQLPDRFDAGQHNIAIFNSTMEEYAAIAGWESRLYRDEALGLTQIVESLAGDPGLHIYLRVHPNLKNIPRDDNYQLSIYAALERTAPQLTIIWPESPIHTYALLDACDVTLTFGSTMGAEACFWGKPSVLGGRAIYEPLDVSYQPESHDELVALLRGTPAAKPDSGAIRYGYWEAVRGTLHQRYRPTSLFGGEFQGRPNRPGLGAQLASSLLWRLGA